ncbi:hypothetical protein [Halobacteriovorax sp. HLS]|uniref:extracellular catalytic domain type 2 short-chain-length polyhydroxyalkanoate depolymerase n=1 Tax=Halobacteriovorax sp. HLS TaxID=2234000 RepID=UPI000FDABBB1|nr:hypothetical protein [Halobacteriovorax sp. HLS]
MINFEAYQLLESNRIQSVQSRVSVSGISSGAYMASQFHISHSRYVNSITLFAGGPYFCSRENPLVATGLCMKDEFGDVNIDALANYTKLSASVGLVDDTSFLNQSKVKIISGMRDFTVRRRVSKSAQHYYKRFDVSEVEFVEDLDIAHTFPTISDGNDCSSPSGAPYISSCGIDGAYMALSTSYKNLNYTDTVDSSRFYKVKQWGALPISSSYLKEFAIAFVPKSCELNSCKLHIAFHGCEQTIDDIGNLFFMKTGYANWAQESGVIVLFPQTKSTLLNPYGCWDWWGYSGPNFHNKYGPQIRAIDEIVQKIFFK